MNLRIPGGSLRRCMSALSLSVAALGCANGGGDLANEGAGAGGQAAHQGGAGGAGGEPGGGCAMDCAQVAPPPCFKSVCNDGSLPGAVGSCVLVEDDGAACDDGLFCTTADTCQGGACVGGPPNDCGMPTQPCREVVCNESSRSCSESPADDGSPCTTDDLCQLNPSCANGACVGTPRDCGFSPLAECNTVACNPATGACDATPDSSKNGEGCTLTGDGCAVDKTCGDGVCGGGVPRDCSYVSTPCSSGVCDPGSGGCVAQPLPQGTACSLAGDPCNAGTCDASGACQPVPLADGTPCNDYNSCTGGDLCTAGVCAGAPVAGCTVYLEDDFEGGCPPSGWTLGGDWECGSPSGVGPPAAHGGAACIATQIDGNYSDGQSYDVAFAEMPPINLGGATEPWLRFAASIETESCCDGVNLKISTDGGATFSLLTAVAPAYNRNVGGQPAWGGETFSRSWYGFDADLAAYAGQTVRLRFSFHSDGTIVAPGVYVDDVFVGEANTIPLAISTGPGLPSARAGAPYATTLQRTGGSSTAAWSIVAGVNRAWLSIDPATGALSGTPTSSEAGPFSVTVRVAEPALPSNFSEAVLRGRVLTDVYSESFEGACPDGWTLAGDWECGAPTGPGPGAAFEGAQCLGTQIDGNYSSSQSYAVATATSPPIDLTSATAPQLMFRMWMDAEAGFDGARLLASTDGVAFTPVTNVAPAYDAEAGGERAWSAREAALGWRLFTADLSAYAGRTVTLRYAFRSDGSVTYPGIYIDSVSVGD